MPSMFQGVVEEVVPLRPMKPMSQNQAQATCGREQVFRKVPE